MNRLSTAFIKNRIVLRFYCSKTQTKPLPESEQTSKEFLVPQTPVLSKIDSGKLPPRTKIDAATIALLERLSLVDCANKKGIETLEDAIAFADQILQVDTVGVEPLVTVLEDQQLRVENDIAFKTNRDDILKNASVTEDEYFVAPPGNIPLEPRQDLLHEKEQKKQ